MTEELRSFAHCFVGPEPIALRAGDQRVIVNGRPLSQPSRIISEGNYQRVMEIVELAGVKIDELEPISISTGTVRE